MGSVGNAISKLKLLKPSSDKGIEKGVNNTIAYNKYWNLKIDINKTPTKRGVNKIKEDPLLKK